MMLQKGRLELFVKRGSGLDEKKDFFGGFVFAAPAVMGFKGGKDLNAGGEAPGN